MTPCWPPEVGPSHSPPPPNPHTPPRPAHLAPQEALALQQAVEVAVPRDALRPVVAQEHVQRLAQAQQAVNLQGRGSKAVREGSENGYCLNDVAWPGGFPSWAWLVHCPCSQ